MMKDEQDYYLQNLEELKKQLDLTMVENENQDENENKTSYEDENENENLNENQNENGEIDEYDEELVEEILRENPDRLRKLKEDHLSIKEYYEREFRKSIAFLDDMVGMEEIKEKFIRLKHYMDWVMMLEQHGGDISVLPKPNLSFLFLGDPGTGKTTLATNMGDILYTLGLIKEPDVTIVRREDLVGENYGAEELKTKEALAKSRDSVFVLDEAYQCFKGGVDKRDPGYHILETIMAELGQPGRCIILAGYKKEMLEMLNVNSGFSSRIPKENIFEFKGSSEQSLLRVVENRLSEMAMRMSPAAKRMLKESIHEQFQHRDRNFGNARQMRQMTDAMVYAHANRIMSGKSTIERMVISSADMATCLSAQNAGKTITRSRIGFA